MRDMEIDRLFDEIEERFDLRTKLFNSLPVDAWDCVIPDDPATIAARPKLMQWTREIGERLQRLADLGVEFDTEAVEELRLELRAARERKLH
jgi:hypothetical protein